MAPGVSDKSLDVSHSQLCRLDGQMHHLRVVDAASASLERLQYAEADQGGDSLSVGGNSCTTASA